MTRLILPPCKISCTGFLALHIVLTQSFLRCRNCGETYYESLLQRKGAISDAHVGRAFENAAKTFFSSTGFELNLDFKVPIGIGSVKKDHAFDLGCPDQEVIVECKSHRWSSCDKVPGAKLTVWNEVIHCFTIAPNPYRKSCLYSKM